MTVPQVPSIILPGAGQNVYGAGQIAWNQPSPPGGGGAIFWFANYRTPGVNLAAVGDGGKFTNAQVGNGQEIVTTLEAHDFPSENHLQFTPVAYESCTNDIRALPIPSAGESIFYRKYFRHESPDAGVFDGQDHPVADDGDGGGSGGGGNQNWEFRPKYDSGEETPGFYNLGYRAIGNLYSAGEVAKHVTRRHEVRLLRHINGAQFSLQIRIYNPPVGGWFNDPFAVGSLIADENSFLNAGNPLAGVLFNFVDLNGLSLFLCGATRAYGMDTYGSVVYRYGGWAVGYDDWIGPYTPAEAAA